MREAERLTGEPVFIKVQVQDLSDCQAALSFWFHINAVSFLPRLPSPALPHSSPPFCCSLRFPSAPLTPARSQLGETREREGKKKKKKSSTKKLSLHAVKLFLFLFPLQNERLVSSGGRRRFSATARHDATDFR